MGLYGLYFWNVKKKKSELDVMWVYMSIFQFIWVPYPSTILRYFDFKEVHKSISISFLYFYSTTFKWD